MTTWIKYPKLGQATTKAQTAAVAGGKGPQFNINQIFSRYLGQMLPPAQQAAQARQSVDDEIKKAMLGYQNSYATEKAALKQQQDRASGFAMAALNLGGQDQKQVIDQYNAAAGNIAGLGGLLTGAVGEAQRASADQTQQQIAALTEGRNAATGLDTAGMQNIARYTGVEMPSQDLYKEAVSAGAEAKFNRRADAEQIDAIARDYGQKILAAAHELDRNKVALEATRPGLYREAVNSLAASSRSDLATMLQAAALQNTIRSSGVSNAGTVATTTATTAKTTGRLPGGKLAPGFYEPNGKGTTPQPIPSGSVINPNDTTKLKPAPKAPSSGGTTKLTPVQLNAMNPAQLAAAGYYRPSAGAAPQKITYGFHVDTAKNPYKLVPDGSSGGPKPPKDSDIKIYNGYVTKALTPTKTSGGAYLKKDPTQDPRSVVLDGPRWVPAMSIAAARTKLLNQYPARMRKLPQVIAFVNNALLAAGFK